MKSQKWKNVFKRLLVWANIILVLFTSPISLVSFLNPSVFWFVAFSGILFPFLLLLNICFIIYWGFSRSRWAFLSIATLLVCTQQIFVLIGTGFFTNNDTQTKNAGTIRVLSWNVSRWDENNKDIKGGITFRPLMFDAIQSSGADVLCLQEFFEPASPNETKYEKNIAYLQKMGYGYYYFFPGFIAPGDLKFGMSIFSKFPITDSAHFSFGKTPHSEGLMFADLSVNGCKLRIFSMHMESFRMGKSDYFGNISGGVIGKTRSFIQSLRQAYKFRFEQAQLVRKVLSESPYPVILCGNLGDIPNSNAYFKVKGDLQDAFLSRGAGIGETFRFISPTLRVDYIMADKGLKFTLYSRPKLPYSDHYPIMVDIDYSSFSGK